MAPNHRLLIRGRGPFSIIVVISLVTAVATLAGCAESDVIREPVPAMVDPEMEMEMEPDVEPEPEPDPEPDPEPEPDAGMPEPDVGMPDPTMPDAGTRSGDAGPLLVDAARPGDGGTADASMPVMAGRSCTHSYGGVYDHLGCSAAYQCVDGSWVSRSMFTMCGCVEPTGTMGCRRDGTTPPPSEGPPSSTDSESIGSPTAGRIELSARMASGTSFVLADTGRDAYFGTEETVYWLRAGFDAARAAHPGAALPQLRDISIARGGVPSGSWPHSSHESGRDADGTYILNSCSTSTGCPLAEVDLADFDAAANWAIFELWLEARVVTYVFVDHALQRPLYEEARRRGATSAGLSAWFQYPRPATERVGIIRHVTNHRNHFHVRFVCPADDAECLE